MANLASALAALSSLLAEDDENDYPPYSKPTRKADESSANQMTAKISFEETLNRMQQYKSKVDQRLEDRRQEKIENELREVIGRPSINSKSQQIKRPPLYMRVNQVLNEKNHHIKVLRSEAQSVKKAELDECTFQPNKSTKRTRTNEQFCLQSQGWTERRRQKLEKQVFERAQQEAKELTLRPSISKASSKLASKRNRTPVIERLTRSKTPDATQQDRSLTPTMRGQAKTPTRMQHTIESTFDLSNIENSFMTVEYKPDLEFMLKSLF
mmetsp:Transcript_25666/g.44939  ORF Transcript_25666/g.44939 Transcript_25666/m.44939 type:complete len:268 (-) Transcript_25666:395-1198(-)